MNDTPERELELPEESMQTEPEFERDLEFYRIPADIVEELSRSLNTLADAETKLANYLLISILSGENPE